MLRIFILLAVISSAMTFAGETPEYTPPMPAIKVNGEPVTDSAIKKIYEYWLKVYSAPGKHLPKEFLDKLASVSRDQAVRAEAVRQYIGKNKLGVSPDALKEDVAAFKAELTAQGKTFEDYLKVRGKTEEEFLAEYAMRSAMTRATMAEAEKNIDAVKKDFEKDRGNMALRRASQIRFSYEKTKYTAHPERTKDDAKKQADYALERARKGEDFAALAKQLSDESVSRDLGGDMGWVKPAAEPKALSAALYALEKAGDIADLVESEQGFHIVKMTELKTDEAELKRFLKQRVYSQTLAAENRIAKEAKVEVEKPPAAVTPDTETKKDADVKKDPVPAKDAEKKKE